MNISNSELCEDLAQKTGLSKRMAKACIDILFDTITTNLEEGNEVTIRKFGRFNMNVSAPRIARNIYRNEPIHVPSRYAIKFKMCRTLADRYNSGDNNAD